MDGFSQQEFDPSAAPFSPFFPFPAELGILGKPGSGDGCSQEIGTSWWDPVLPNLPGITVTPTFLFPDFGGEALPGVTPLCGMGFASLESRI